MQEANAVIVSIALAGLAAWAALCAISAVVDWIAENSDDDDFGDDPPAFA
jgi:hypothetical protein